MEATSKKYKHSSWTDIPILLILVLYTCGLVYIGVYSILTGMPGRLLNPVDSYGHICGSVKQPLVYDGASMYGKEYLFFLNQNPYTSKSVCVSACPIQSINDVSEFYQWLIQNEFSNLCESSIEDDIKAIIKNSDYDDVDSNNSSDLMALFSQHGPCPSLPIFATIPLLKRCVPYVMGYSTGTKKAVDKISLDIHPLKMLMLDAYRFRFTFIFMIPLLVYILATIMTFALKQAQDYGLWFSLVLGLMAPYGFTTFLVWSLICSHYYLKTAQSNDIQLKVDAVNHYSLLAMTIVISLFTVGASLAYFWHRRRVYKLFAIFKQARLYFSCMRLLWILPTIFVMLLLPFFYALLTVLSYLVTTDQAAIDAATAYLTFRFKWSTLTYLQLVYLLGSVLWLPNFNINYQRMLIANLTAKFYFSRGNERRVVPLKKTLLYALKVFRHSGSLALLSMLDILLWLPKRICGDFVHSLVQDNRTGTVEEIDNRLNRVMYKTVQWRYFSAYPNETPLVLVGIEKFGYFKALKKTHLIYLSCPFPLDGFTSTLELIFWLAKLGPLSLAGMLGLILMQHEPDSHLFAIPLAACCLISYFVVDCVLTPIQTMLSTLLLCFAEDLRLAYASPDPIYYATPGFLEIIKVIAPNFGPVGFIERQMSNKNDTTGDL